MYGVPSMPAPVVGVVNSGSASEAAGIKVGDRIVAFNRVENPTWEGVRDEVLISPEMEIPLTVDRGGQRIPLTVKPTKTVVDGNGVGEIGIVPDAGVEPVEAQSVLPGYPAAAAGLQVGDRVIAFNGQTVRNSQELTNQIRENKDAPGKLTVERNGRRLELVTQAKANDKGVYMIGATFASGAVTTRVPVGLGGAASFAMESNLRILRLTGKVFGQMFAGERSVKDAGLSGPVGIVQIISKVVSEMGFAGLFGILAVISLNLGVFNLLPIPLLDGGQIMVLGIEKVMSWFGKTLSMAIKEKIQLAGLAVILLLMVFTLFLDISRFF
jgi:regulator of sigma E protease